MGEAEEVKRGSLAACWRATVALRAEVDEARLVGMQRKPKPAKTFSQYSQYPFGVAVSLEGHHEVIGKPYQISASAQARSHLLRGPSVQHVMQEDVREDR